MYLCFLLFFILFIPHIRGNSLSTPKDFHVNVTTESHLNDFNNTKVSLITEGGSVEPDPITATLPKDGHSNLINLDKEIGKTKLKSIVPRKGVDYNPVEDNITNANLTKERIDTTILESKPLDKKLPTTAKEPLQTKSSTKPDLPKAIKENNNNTSPNVEMEIKKKPLVLSAEAVLETDRKVQNAKGETSSKPIVFDQLPSPKIKYQPLSTSSHPGMVMPIVITMLVVPMFAVLGYMALRRGQEAWKNRHYKRMDFLLDGMYND